MGMGHEMDILRIAVLGIAGVLLALLLQKEKSEYSMFISMAVCICIFIYILGKVETVINFAKKMQTFVAVDQTYITLILKMVGITYVAEFAMLDMRQSEIRSNCLLSCRFWCLVFRF